mmetsp:Transcript_32262/g.63085  ORF Transcript_32262/g.63085 Transcript_32262/m.63085 type:complete len:276 (-) Transcript_32262:1025-1852(-)
MPFQINYRETNFQLSPAKVIFGFPEQEIRLTLSGMVPAAVMVTSAVVYYILISWVLPATKPQTEVARRRLAGLRDLHNFSLFLFSAFCCLSTAGWLYMEGQLFDWNALMCTPVEGTWLRPLSVVFVVSKIWEWGDTAFLIWLGNKPAQFLHLYHHATTFWLFCFVVNMPGPEKFGLLMNGGVHMLMYSHYWRSWPKMLVPLITALQITQLATVTYAWSVNPASCPQAGFTSAPSEHPLEFATPYAMVPVYLYFFCVFFAKRFVCPVKKDSHKKKN